MHIHVHPCTSTQVLSVTEMLNQLEQGAHAPTEKHGALLASVYSECAGWIRYGMCIVSAALMDATVPHAMVNYNPPPPINHHSRLMLERPPWSGSVHHKFPPGFRDAVQALLLCHARKPGEGKPENDAPEEMGIASLPMHLLEHVIAITAYPMSVWLE